MTKEGLEAAIAEIDSMMQQELPNLIDERRFRRREPEKVERDELGRVSIPILCPSSTPAKYDFQAQMARREDPGRS